jgi:hypothetical protein
MEKHPHRRVLQPAAYDGEEFGVGAEPFLGM